MLDHGLQTDVINVCANLRHLVLRLVSKQSKPCKIFWVDWSISQSRQTVCLVQGALTQDGALTRLTGGQNYFLWELPNASSRAPTYFPSTNSTFSLASQLVCLFTVSLWVLWESSTRQIACITPKARRQCAVFVDCCCLIAGAGVGASIRVPAYWMNKPGTGNAKAQVVDGGLTANDPSVLALVFMMLAPLPTTQVAILSIGCGNLIDSMDVVRQDAGQLDWITGPLISILTSGNEEIAPLLVERLLQSFPQNPQVWFLSILLFMPKDAYSSASFTKIQMPLFEPYTQPYHTYQPK